MRGQAYETVLVLGMGASGEAAARLLLAEGSRVTIVDSGDTAALRSRARELERTGVTVALGCRELPACPFSLCVASPGIPSGSEWIVAVKARGTQVLSELELGWSRCRSRVVAITGSNGKSTAVKLCRESLVQAGCRAEAAGNYGPPICRAVAEHPDADWLVVEVSSFQLENVEEFRPDVGVLLNIHPNHLDRHGGMEVYAALKARLFARMNPGDAAVISEDAMDSLPAGRMPAPHWVTFGRSSRADYRYEAGRVFWGEKGNPGLDLSRVQSIRVTGTVFDNEILGLTAAATVAAVRSCGYEAGSVEEAAARFQPLPHRMQTAGEIAGVRFVDNSKATNLASLAASLVMVQGSVRLVAGGMLKESELRSIKELLAKKLRGAYLIGKAAKIMATAWGDVIPCHMCSDIKDAVWRAWREAERGETVLLSPGCASFDQFSGFEDRGNQFLAIVESIKKERDVR